MSRDRSCPITGAPAPDDSGGYDWEADAIGCWQLCVGLAATDGADGHPWEHFAAAGDTAGSAKP